MTLQKGPPLIGLSQKRFMLNSVSGVDFLVKRHFIYRTVPIKFRVNRNV